MSRVLHVPLSWRAPSARASPVSGDLEGLAINGDVIVEVGSHQLIYSDDGVSWSTPESEEPCNWWRLVLRSSRKRDGWRLLAAR
jgi:hypothetical protein